MLLDIARLTKGLRGQKHNGDVPFRSPKLLSGNPKILVDVDLRNELTFDGKLTLLQKYQQNKVEYENVLSKT